MFIIEMCDDDSVGDWIYLNGGVEVDWETSKIITPNPKVIRGDFDYDSMCKWYHQIAPRYRTLGSLVEEMDTQYEAFREVCA